MRWNPGFFIAASLLATACGKSPDEQDKRSAGVVTAEVPAGSQADLVGSQVDPGAKYRELKIVARYADGNGDFLPVVQGKVYGYCKDLELLTPLTKAMEDGQSDDRLWSEDWVGRTDGSGTFRALVPDCAWQIFVSAVLPDGSVFLGWSRLAGLDASKVVRLHEGRKKKLSAPDGLVHSDLFVRPGGFPIFLRNELPPSGSKETVTLRLGGSDADELEFWGQGKSLTAQGQLAGSFLFEWRSLRANAGKVTLARNNGANAAIDVAWQRRLTQAGQVFEADVLDETVRPLSMRWKVPGLPGLEGRFPFRLESRVGTNRIALGQGDYFVSYSRPVQADDRSQIFGVEFSPIRYRLRGQDSSLNLRLNNQFYSRVLANHSDDFYYNRGNRRPTSYAGIPAGLVGQMVTVDGLTGHPILRFVDQGGRPQKASARVRILASKDDECGSVSAKANEFEATPAGGFNRSGQLFFLKEAVLGKPLPPAERSCWRVSVPFGKIRLPWRRPILNVSDPFSPDIWDEAVGVWRRVAPPGTVLVASRGGAYEASVPRILAKVTRTFLDGLEEALGKMTGRAAINAKARTRRVIVFPAIGGNMASSNHMLVDYDDIIGADIVNDRKLLHEIGHQLGFSHGGPHESAVHYAQITEGRFQLSGQAVKYVFYDEAARISDAAVVRKWPDVQTACWTKNPGGFLDRYYLSLYHYARQVAVRKDCRLTGMVSGRPVTWRGDQAFDRFVYLAEAKSSELSIRTAECGSPEYRDYELYTVAALSEFTGEDLSRLAEDLYGIETTPGSLSSARKQVRKMLGSIVVTCD